MAERLPFALVTGAAHRLGKAFALRLARLGYAIGLHYHASLPKAEATAGEISALGVPVFPLRADLTRPEDVEHLFQQIDDLLAEQFRFSTLVNSAALMPRADVRSLSAADFDAAIALNLRAPFLCAQQAARRMTSGGLIVNISDIGAAKAWTGFPAYTISKAGLESLTKILARALAPDIRVNAIAPGLVLRAEEMPPADWERLVNRLPARRAAEPDEVADALEFLIKNEYITGQTIAVDGGYSLL